MQGNFKTWRDAASLIIIGKQAFQNQIQIRNNFKILTLKRGSKAKFMPNTYVFPGGIVEKSDNTHDWLKLYEHFGIQHENFECLKTKNNPPIFNTSPNEISKHISLRITAIRETFEECGILICKSSKINYAEDLNWASYIGDSDLEKWQKIVYKDSTKFLELCYEFEIYPDIFALKNWSNWLTPSTMSKRFDTMFFLATFMDLPPSIAEENEVQQLNWSSPEDYLKLSHENKILLPPPQFYEISRLKSFDDIEKLLNFAHDRSNKGCERFLPLRIKIPNGEIGILPGDDLYPKDESQNGHLSELNEVPECNTMHRMIHMDHNKNTIVTSNYAPKFDHVRPIH